MSLQEFKLEVSQWGRNRRGRLSLDDIKKAAILTQFQKSGETLSAFCLLTGLKLSTVSKIINDGSNGKLAANKESSMGRFEPVKIFQSNKMESNRPNLCWRVSGPNGLEVNCDDISQVVQLWRALC